MTTTFLESQLACASDVARWRASAWPVCTRWRGCPRVPPAAGGRSNPRAPHSTTHANLPRSLDSFHAVSNRTRFGTPSSPSGSTKHAGTGVLLATRERPGIGRCNRATSLYLRKSKLFDKHVFRAGACFPCPRLFTISPANCQSGVTDKTLFAPGDANLYNTVSLRRSAMPNDG